MKVKERQFRLSINLACYTCHENSYGNGLRAFLCSSKWAAMQKFKARKLLSYYLDDDMELLCTPPHSGQSQVKRCPHDACCSSLCCPQGLPAASPFS